MSSDDIALTPSEELTISAYNQVGAQWAAAHNKPGYWAREMNRFNQLLPIGHILEIGSGGGRDAKELIALGYGYTGTDISTGLLQVARQAIPDHNFYLRSVYDLNLNAKFDGFWASAVLLHVPRPRIDLALSQIHHTLRVGAIGFISLKDGQGAAIETEEIDGQTISRQFTYWSKENFELALQSTSFQVVDYMFRDQSSRTKWHCFFVQAI